MCEGFYKEKGGAVGHHPFLIVILSVVGLLVRHHFLLVVAVEHVELVGMLVAPGAVDVVHGLHDGLHDVDVHFAVAF